MRAREEMIDWENLKPLLNELNKAAENSELARIRKLLIQMVPEFSPNSHTID